MQQTLIYIKTIQTMSSQNKGLTVGELTITVGTLIIAVLIWSNLVKRQPQKQSLREISTSIQLVSTTFKAIS